MKRLSFPPGFSWGFATSAFQIEGAANEGGRGESIWDRFTAQKGAILDGSDASVACDHYHRWREDVALMRELGAKAYRFSIAWPRVLPEGVGAVNPAGLDFYDALVDGLLAADIAPMATLYHWDLPQALQDRGGWQSRATADAFARYAEVVCRRLGDRVRSWVTHNEPWCIAHLGHHTGEHAPGHQNPTEALCVGHHLLLSHGWAVAALRATSPRARVGITLNLVPAYPASPSAADREAARHFDAAFNRWYLDPLFRGGYPSDGVEDHARQGHLPGGAMPWVQAGDLSAIAAPIDFLGVNYYSREICRSKVVSDAQNAPRLVSAPPERERTDMGWEVFPQGLRDLLVRLHKDYKPKELIITENGAAYSHGPDASGQVADELRRAYVESHLRAAHEAIAEGVPLTGYYLWSLLDNFEWAAGYTKRFGAIWVDFSTQRRLPKASALWYRDTIAANGLLDLSAQASAG